MPTDLNKWEDFKSFVLKRFSHITKILPIGKLGFYKKTHSKSG